jgi:hypothetical protein
MMKKSMNSVEAPSQPGTRSGFLKANVVSTLSFDVIRMSIF